jgi:hypothetical protein
MAFDQQPGTEKLRRTYVDTFVKGFASRNYRFKEVLRVESTNAWNNDYFREHPDDLTAGSTRNVQGIARGAAFPQAFVKWDKIRSVIRKYGLEQSIPFEDLISDEIQVAPRVLLRIARGVVKSADDGIRATIVADNEIQSITITDENLAWNGASANIIDNLEQAEEKIADYDYPTTNLWVYVNPHDKRQVVNYLVANGNKLSRLTDEKVTNRNGKIGVIGNKTFIVSNSVQASECIVAVPKVGGAWKELVPLSTHYKEEPMKDALVRAGELGQTQITDPKAFVRITGTEY